MTKMLTLFGKDIGKLPYNDLKREKAIQVYLLKLVKIRLKREEYFREQRKVDTLRGRDKIAILKTYVEHLESFIEEMDYWLDRKIEPEEPYNKVRKRKDQIREANKIRHRRMMAEDVRTLRLKRAIERDSLYVSWDKERFLLIAADRGYQTENALVADMAKELVLDRSAVRVLMDKGRFTWGQVLVLGAMFDMSPKEFCDTFLAGYFVEHNGNYRASYENMNKWDLLKNAIRPDVIEVGADGKPADEEEWFE